MAIRNGQVNKRSELHHRAIAPSGLTGVSLDLNGPLTAAVRLKEGSSACRLCLGRSRAAEWWDCVGESYPPSEMPIRRSDRSKLDLTPTITIQAHPHVMSEVDVED
jgi:hypothetical protein